MPDDAPTPPATPANWRTAPFRRWAFQHVGEILPTAVIEAAPGAATPEALQSLEGFALPGPGGATLTLDTFLEATSTDAMVILHRGQVAFERYGHGMTAQTPHILMSTSKAMTGLIAGVLADQGVLDLDAMVSDYVPEIEGSAYGGASIRHLLDMRAGVVLDPAQEAAYAAALSGEPDPSGEPAPTFHQVLASLDRAKGPHGGPFSYISANTDLLGWAIERATGLDVAALVSDLLWKPLGAEHPASIVVDAEGSPWCAGGFSFTARDFARVGALVLDGGRRGDRQIVPKAWIDDLTQGGDRNAWKTGEWGAAFSRIGGVMSYRAGWYAIHDAPDLLFAMGVHGQNLFIDHANQLVIAKLSSQDRFDYPTVSLTHAAIPELRRCVLASAART
jgi:CubicO group peptidase (beta-lactamase class C family)